MSPSGIDLNLLPALDALLTERNVTRAAERLSLSQPTMSAALARLRKRLDDPLLVRDGRHYVLTPLASSLVVPVREALTSAEAVLRARRTFDPQRDERSFTVVTSDYVALVLLSPLLVELAEEAPNVRVTVSSYGADNSASGDRLRRGGADLAICPPVFAGALVDMPSSVLFEDRFVVAADRDHPDIGDEMDLELLTKLPFLAARGLVSFLATQPDAQALVREADVATETFVVVPLMIAGSRMVAIVQERLARAVSAAGRLRLFPCPVPVLPLVVSMYWNPRDTDDPAHAWLRRRLAEHAQRL